MGVQQKEEGSLRREARTGGAGEGVGLRDRSGGSLREGRPQEANGPGGGLKARGGEGESALGAEWKTANRKVSCGRFQPSLLEPVPPSFPPHIRLLAMMSPFLLRVKVQPAEWPVASLGAGCTPSPQAAGEMPM